MYVCLCVYLYLSVYVLSLCVSLIICFCLYLSMSVCSFVCVSVCTAVCLDVLFVCVCVADGVTEDWMEVPFLGCKEDSVTSLKREVLLPF